MTALLGRHKASRKKIGRANPVSFARMCSCNRRVFLAIPLLRYIYTIPSLSIVISSNRNESTRLALGCVRCIVFVKRMKAFDWINTIFICQKHNFYYSLSFNLPIEMNLLRKQQSTSGLSFICWSNWTTLCYDSITSWRVLCQLVHRMLGAINVCIMVTCTRCYPMPPHEVHAFRARSAYARSQLQYLMRLCNLHVCIMAWCHFVCGFMKLIRLVNAIPWTMICSNEIFICFIRSFDIESHLLAIKMVI